MKRIKIFWAIIVMALIGTAMSMQSCSKDDDSSSDKTCVYKIEVQDYSGKSLYDYIKNEAELEKISDALYSYIGASNNAQFSVTGTDRADCDAKVIEKCKVAEKRLNSDGYKIRVVYAIVSAKDINRVISTISVN